MYLPMIGLSRQSIPLDLGEGSDGVALPTGTPTALLAVAQVQVIRVERVHVSHYWPPLGGPNCARFVGGQCLSKTSSGEPWQNWVDKGAACVREWGFDTRFRLPDGRVFNCVDRGGAIRYGYTPGWMTYDGLGWVDLLTAQPGYKFGEVVEVEIIK